MEDNTSSDDEIKDSPVSPKQGGKKLKLNDGSSKDSLMESGSSVQVENDENVDSGVSADKSESTSSEDRAAGAGEGPSNMVINAAPSGSNIRAILLNISRPRRARSYRKRKTPGRDSDSNDSSRDSDDLSASESQPGSRPDDNSNSDVDTGDLNLPTFRRFSDSDSSNSSSSTNSYGSDDLQISGDTDTDEDDLWNRSNEDGEDDENKDKPPSVLLKPQPKHNYLLLKEIIHREMGLTFPHGKTTKADVMFEQRFYGSLHAVYRMKKLHNLCKHRGCVNSINFHPEGHLLASGSDDTNVVVWDWAKNKEIQTIKTGHKANVFQSKFLYLNARSQLNIVTCARDGQVRLVQCPPSGAAADGSGTMRRRLGSHARAAHKLCVSPLEPHAVLSCGEDGLVLLCDVRADHATKLFTVEEKGSSIPLYSVAGHPLEPRQLLLAGRDRFLRVYDRRSCARPLHMYCPATFKEHQNNAKKKVRLSLMHLTCAVYNHDGSEILGSYNDEDIYLFDAKNDVYDKDNPTGKDGYRHRYSGHRNSATFKGVSFFGPKSEYVVSGSDCSYIYMWDKNTESIVQWMKGDTNGVVNCIETHPSCPVMATSGLDKDVKIWIPRSHKDPTYEGIGRVVRDNVVSQLNSPLFNDFLPQLYSAWRGENRLFTDDGPQYGGNIEFDGNVCTVI